MYTNSLSQSKKAKAIVFLIQKYGNVCFYCKTQFVEEIKDFQRAVDHLNGDEKENHLENLCLAHRKCNDDKRTNPDLQIMGDEQYKANCKDPFFHEIESASESVGEREKKAQGRTDDDELTDGQVSKEINKTLNTYLTEKLPKDGPRDSRLSVNTTLTNVTYLVQKETGRGSIQAVRNALAVRCTEISEFEIYREAGKRWIRRKDGQ